DEPILEFLASHDADFDLEGRGAPLTPLDSGPARAYLANPDVLHWIAIPEGSDRPVGFLLCHRLPLRSGSGQELLLYEIGVHLHWRRRGIGRALIAHMENWMHEHGITDIWVCADNDAAVEFYRACGFLNEECPPVVMTRILAAGQGAT